MDCSLPGSSVHGISQESILEWAAISFSKGIFLTQGSNMGLLHCRWSPALQADSSQTEPPGKPKYSRIRYKVQASPEAQMAENLPAVQETWDQSLGQEDLLEKRMATHSNILTWRIPWTEKPGRLQSTGLQRVRHD